MTQTNTATQPVSSPAPAVPGTDDLGIDRAFLLQMAQVPFIALGFVLLAFLSHLIWEAFAGSDARNYGPMVVLAPA